MAEPVHVSDATFDSEVIKAEVPVLVDFWAEWCGPCKMISPVLEEIAGDKAGVLQIAKLNVDENPRTAQRFQVMSIPTLLLFKGGEAQSRIVGARPKSQILAEVEPHLA